MATTYFTDGEKVFSVAGEIPFSLGFVPVLLEAEMVAELPMKGIAELFTRLTGQDTGKP